MLAPIYLLRADFNNDGYLRMDEMEKSQGIEKKIFDDVLRDADVSAQFLLVVCCVVVSCFLVSCSAKARQAVQCTALASHFD